MSASLAPRLVEQRPAPLRVETVTDTAELLALESVWNRLVDDAGIDHPFLRHEWVRTWWQCFGSGRELQMLVVRAGGEAIGLAPLMMGRTRMFGITVRRLEFIRNVHTPRFDFLVSRRPEEVYRALWAHLAARSDWDVLQLAELPVGSRTLVDLPRLAEADGFRAGVWASIESPYVPIAGGWERYFAGLRPKHRSNLRNRTKRLGCVGPVARRVVSSEDGLAPVLADVFGMEARSWKGKEGTAILSRPETTRFYSILAQLAAQRGWLRLHLLEVGPRRVAFEYTLEYAGKVQVLKVGYDPEYAPLSPQNILCGRVLQDAFERGLAEYEFLGTREDWKMEWARHVRRHAWLFVFGAHWRGRVLHQAKFRLLPTLQRASLYRAARDLVVGRRTVFD